MFLSVPNKDTNKNLRVCMCVCVLPIRWLVLDTDTRDLVSVHTDGNEMISNVKYSPGKSSLVCVAAEAPQTAAVVLDADHVLRVIAGLYFVLSDGNFLAVASHDNFVYIYAVTENGRKYSRVGKCTVSGHL